MELTICMPALFLKALDESYQPDELAVMYEELEEGMFQSVLQTGLDVAGLIPGVGEFFDVLNGLIYLTSSPPNYLFAALSFVSCVPVIGDTIGKGGKLAIWAEKAITRLPKTSRAFAEASKVIRRTKEVIRLNMSKIEKALNWIAAPPKPGEEDPWEKIRPYIPQLREAIQIFSREPKTV